MTRMHVETNAKTGVATTRPYTVEEEAKADAVVLQPRPRDPLAELDALKAKLVAKGVIEAETAPK